MDEIPESVVIVVSDDILDPFFFGGFLGNFPQRVEVFRVEALKTAAEVGLFEMVGSPVFGLLGVGFPQVLVE